MPQTGDEVVVEGKKLAIMEMLGKRISKVKLEKAPEMKEEETPTGE